MNDVYIGDDFLLCRES